MEKQRQVTLYTDGSCAPTNPDGFAGCGIAIETPDSSYSASKFLGSGKGWSSDIAEYHGLILGLETLISLEETHSAVKVMVDYVDFVSMFRDKWTPDRKSPAYKLWKKVLKLSREFEDIHFNQVGSSQNLADKYAKNLVHRFRGTPRWNEMLNGSHSNFVDKRRNK